MYNILVTDKNKFYNSDSSSEGEMIIWENIIEDIEITKEPAIECISTPTESNPIETSEEKNEDDTSINKNIFVVVSSDEDKDKVPKDYMFPSYYTFILFSSFADHGDGETLLLTHETFKSKNMVVVPREEKPIRKRKGKH